jgi:hypothetical protein
VVADEATEMYRITQQSLARLEQDPQAAAVFHRVVTCLLSERTVRLIEVVNALQR